MCECNEGYTLGTDRTSCIGMLLNSFRQQSFDNQIESLYCIDNAECSDGANNCEQLCNNRPGSFECLCLEGYELNNDGFTCTGMLQLYDIRAWLRELVMSNIIGSCTVTELHA